MKRIQILLLSFLVIPIAYGADVSVSVDVVAPSPYQAYVGILQMLMIAGIGLWALDIAKGANVETLIMVAVLVIIGLTALSLVRI